MGDEFDEERAQVAFREQMGRMVSKRGATGFVGPSAEKEEVQRRELRERYEPLKRFATEDGVIEKLPVPVNEQEILDAWKRSVSMEPGTISSGMTRRKRKSEAERVKELIRSKSGLKRGGNFASMRGSYRPPNTIEREEGGGWIATTEETKPAGVNTTAVEEDGRVKGWRTDELRNSAWWDDRWKSRDALREEKGRLAINPVTGKLEDLAAGTKVGFPEQRGKKSDDEKTGDLLMAEDIPFECGMRVNREGKVERISFDQFLEMMA